MVVLTNEVKDRPAASALYAVAQGQATPEQLPPGLLQQGPSALAEAFGSTYTVAVVLVVLCLIPAFFLPRKKIERSPEQMAESPVPAALH